MEVPYLRHVMGKELSSREYRKLDEQLFRAMAVLHDQKQRHGVARLVGMHAPTAIVTPTVQKLPTSREMTAEFLKRAYDKLPFALPNALARKQIKDREAKFLTRGFQETAEPATARRKNRPPKSVEIATT